MQLKGELTTKTGKKLVLNYKALVLFEEISGDSVFRIFTNMEQGTLPTLANMRDFILAALRADDDHATVDDAYEILNEEPDLFYQLVAASQPRAGDISEPETKKKPVKKSRVNTHP